MRTIVALLLLTSVAVAGENQGWVVTDIKITPLRSKSTVRQPSVTSTRRYGHYWTSAEIDHINAMYQHAKSMEDYATDYEQHPMHGARAVTNSYSTLVSMIDKRASYKSIVQQYKKTRTHYEQWKLRDKQTIVVPESCQ